MTQYCPKFPDTYVQEGLPKKVNDENLRPFWQRHTGLSILNDC